MKDFNGSTFLLIEYVLTGHYTSDGKMWTKITYRIQELPSQDKGDITYRVLRDHFYSSLVYLLAKEYKCRYELLKVHTKRVSNT